MTTNKMATRVVRTMKQWAVLCSCSLLLIGVVAASGIHRHLGDFDELNALLKDALIYLGDTSVSEGLILNLSVKNLRCTNFALADMNVASELVMVDGFAMDKVLLDISITDLNMDCFLDYTYRTLIFGGSGRATVQSRGSDASARTVLRSPDLTQYPPLLVSLDSCNANIQLQNLQFLDGGILGLAPVESVIERLIENQAAKTVCRELESISTTQIVQWLSKAKTALDDYPSDIGIVDPLIAEQTTLVIPENMKLLNMLQRETEIGELFAFGLEELVTFLSKQVVDPHGVTATGMDMRANVVLRDMILEDRALNLNVADFAFITDGVLWENQDKLTNTKITLNKIRLLGLDTLTRFRPFEAVGNYTIQNELAWEYITFELDATIDIQPSTSSDSVLVNPGTTRVVEDITVEFGVENIGAISSLLLAIDQELMESLQLGSLLQSDDLLKCLLSTLLHIEIPALSVFVGNVREPTLEGFVSVGLDRLFTDSALAAFQMYEAVLLNAAPAFFQIAVREAINKRMDEELKEFVQGPKGCPVQEVEVFSFLTESTDFVDFRDLMLEPEAAAAAGGTGQSPYGDVMATVTSQLTDRFLNSGDDGLPKLNSALLRPATEAQSGQAGTLRWDEDVVTLFQYNSSSFKQLLNRVEIQSNSISMTNIDTVIQPLQLLTVAGAHNLTNAVYMGPVASRPVSFSTDLLFRIDGEGSPLAVDNLFELSIAFENAVDFDILATVMRKPFLEFPLKDMMNVHCWLAALPAPPVDAEGNLFGHSSGSDYIGLQLSRLLMSIDSLDFDVQCISCTSAGGEALPEIMAALKSSGATFIIEERFQNFINEIAVAYWESMQIHQHIAEARQLCPHSPYFDAAASTTFEWPSVPNLSREASESMVVFSMLATNFAIVLTAKSHLLRPAEPTDPLSGELSLLPLEDGSKLVDWSDLGNSLGEWALSGLDEMRSFAGGMSADEITGEIDLGANILVRELLDEDGSFEMDMNGLDLGTTSEIGAKIARMRIFGLDTMLEADILDIIGSQTIANRMRFKTLRLELDIEMAFQNGFPESTTFSFQLNEVAVDSSLLLAVDWNKLGEMKVGSMLQLKKILPCLVSKLHSISITQLLVSAGSIDEPQISGFLSEDASTSLSEASRRFLSTFAEDLVGSIPKVCDMTIRQVLNSVLLDFMANEEEYCAYDSAVSNSGIIDFRDLFLAEEFAKRLGGSGSSPYGDTFRLLFEALQEQIAAVDESNQTALNEMIVRPMTFEQSNVNGSLFFPGEVLNATGTARLSNWVVLIDTKVSDIRIENLDSIGSPLNLLQPVFGQASVLNNSISVGVGPKPLRLVATAYLALRDDNEMNLENEVEVALDVNALTFILTGFLAMSESSFFALPLTNLQDLNCWLSSISPDSFDSSEAVSSLFYYGLSAEKASLNISCVSCGSPKFSELIETLYNPGDTQGEVDSFVAEARGLLDSFLGSDFLQNLLREIVSDAGKVCAVSEDYEEDAVAGDFWVQPETYIGLEATARDTKMNLFNIGNAIVAAVMLISALVARFVIRRKNRKWLESLPEAEAIMLRHQDEIERKKELFLNQHTNSMFRSEQIPRRIQYGVPFLCVANIGIFLGAHIALLNYVNIEAQIAGEKFTVEHFLEFRFFEAALRTYSNGGSEMAIFLIFFSGIWPYIKLLSALVLWFVPPNRLSVNHRGKLFLWMDVLTKLSIIDIVTMLAAIAALFVYIGGPGQNFYNSDELYAMTLVVVPQAGFYCIIIAQRLNRVSSRFFLEYHDKIVKLASEEYKRLHHAKLANQEISFASGKTFDTAMSTKASFSHANSTIVSIEESATNCSDSPSRIRKSSPGPYASLKSPDRLNLSHHNDLEESTTGSLTSKPRFQMGRTEDAEDSATNSLESLAGMDLIERDSAEESTINSLESRSRIAKSNRQMSSDFLIYNPDDMFLEHSPPKEVTLREHDTDVESSRMAAIVNRLKCNRGRSERMMGGTLAVIFALIFVLILFIIGCTLAPSMSLDVNEVLGIAIESGRTYEDAVNEFSVFRVVSLVLLETRFVLDSTADYVGLGFLLGAAGLSVVLFPAMQAWKNLQEWRKTRRDPGAEPLLRKRKKKQRKSVIPGFTNRLKVWNHMEVFVVSFCIASWQLGAVVAYIVHNYCDLLERFYEALGYVGLVERTSINCFRVQMADPFTLLMLIGSFFLMLTSFLMQMHTQYKKNKEHIEELLDEE